MPEKSILGLSTGLAFGWWADDRKNAEKMAKINKILPSASLCAARQNFAGRATTLQTPAEELTQNLWILSLQKIKHFNKDTVCGKKSKKQQNKQPTNHKESVAKHAPCKKAKKQQPKTKTKKENPHHSTNQKSKSSFHLQHHQDWGGRGQGRGRGRGRGGQGRGPTNAA
jgi:hypothetical protein